MKHVLTIGGATLDSIIEYRDMETLVHQRQGLTQSYLLLEEGKKIEVTDLKRFSGGGSTNTAVSFKRQGYDVSVFCKLGNDVLADQVLQELQAFGIDTQYIARSESRGTATSFVVPSLKGDRVVFAYRGANTTLLAKDLPEAAIEQAELIYITSLSDQAAEHLPDIVAKAHARKIPVAVNPGISQLKLGASFLKSSLKHIETLILNLEEAQQFMESLMQSDKNLQKHADSHDPAALLETTVQFADTQFNLRQFFKVVLSMGPKTVVVTDGTKGVFIANQEHIYFHPAVKTKIVNTLGAGDAFGSSFVGALYGGEPIDNAIRCGVINSASVICYPDAKSGLLEKSAIIEEAAKLDKKHLSILNW